MALSGEENPDLGAIKVGSTRGEVEMHLGSPVRSSSGENGTRTDIYEYEIGNEPFRSERSKSAASARFSSAFRISARLRTCVR
jgi:hypothetical protein